MDWYGLAWAQGHLHFLLVVSIGGRPVNMLKFVPIKKAERRILAQHRLGYCVKRAVALLSETGVAQHKSSALEPIEPIVKSKYTFAKV